MAPLDAITKSRMQLALRQIARHCRPAAAYLFGSQAEGRANEWSDYDVAIFVRGAENWDLPQLARLCVQVQKEAGNDIELHVFPETDFMHPEPASFAAYIMSHGIALPLEGKPE